jgi:ligand-binding sensor domain-containing protein
VTALPKCLSLRRCFLLGILLLGQQLFALDPSRTVFQYNLQSWTRQNGLPFNRIRQITQTPDGYLWMATQNGLMRFDGSDFTRTAIPGRYGWHSQGIETLTLSPRGGLWFGLDSGSCGYFDGTNQFHALTGSWLPPQYVRTVAEQSDGTLWFAGRYGVTGLIGGNTNRLFTNNVMDAVLVTYEDSQHRVWLGTIEKGLYYIEAGQVKQFPDTNLIGNTIRAITLDQQGQLWVGTSMGLRCYDRTFKPNDAFSDATEVQSLLADKHGAVWVGTTGNGLVRYVNGEIDHLRKTNGLAEDYVSALFEDREGSLWVGTRNGLTQISDLKFPAASTVDGLLSEPVHGVCASSNGGIWCATSAGIYNYHDRLVSDIPAPNTNAGFYVKRVLEARNGDLYAISGRREVLIFSKGKVVARHTNREWPVAMAEDDRGVIVSRGGLLYRVDRSESTLFVYPGPAPQFNWIRNLHACADGSLLVASVNGAFRIHMDRVEHWATNEGLLDLDVSCLTEDKEGTIWLGHANGLSRIQNHKAIPVPLGLPDSVIYAIVPDDLGNLWINSSVGVIRANRRSLNAFADGKTPHPDFTLYDGMDALRTIDLTEVEGVGCKTADGKIWLPGPLGAVQIDPAHITGNSVAPPRLYSKSFCQRRAADQFLRRVHSPGQR